MSLLTLLGPRYGVLRARAGVGDWRDVGCGGPSTGRLRMQLPDGSWVQEACDADLPSTFTDNFNRANSSTLGSPWVVVNDDGTTTSALFGIDTNRAQPQSSVNNSNNVVAYVPSLGADADVSVTLAAVGFNSALVVRLDPSIMRYHYFYFGINAGYQVRTGTSNGTFHLTPAMECVAGDVVRVVASGTSFTVYRNGVVVASFTSTVNQTATAHGLAGIPSLDTTTRFDDFSVTYTPARHPLRIEDPTNPGTWIDVACMVPV